MHIADPEKQAQYVNGTLMYIQLCALAIHETVAVKSHRAASENVCTVLISRTFPDAVDE